MELPSFDVFISYRRETGAHLVHLVGKGLEERGYRGRVFIDVNGLGAGRFDEALLRRIEQARAFVLLLTRGCLDRCANESDWVRREVAHAIGREQSGELCIVSLRDPAFTFPADLPSDIAALGQYNWVEYSHEHSEAALDKLCRLLPKPDSVLHPTQPPPRSGRLLRWAGGIVLALAVVGALTGAVVGYVAALGRDVPAVAEKRMEPESGQRPVKPPLGLYWHGFVQRQIKERWEELRLVPGMELHDGDQFRLVVCPNADCFVSVINAGSDGAVTLLLGGDGRGQDCKANQHYTIPNGIDMFDVDDKPGREIIYLVASYDPLDNVARHLKQERDPHHSARLAKQIEQLGAPPSGKVQTRSGELIDTRNIRIEPDRRLARTTLKNGVRSEQEMQFVPGTVHVVKVIPFEHKPAPRTQP